MHTRKISISLTFFLCLMLPVLAGAGSVSTRYDVTFGGFVKYDLGYSTKNGHADRTTAPRSSSGTRSIRADEYGNTFATGGETRFNFLVRGPDLWGAKTSAFIEGDFRGATTGNAYGGFQLRHAFMMLKWDFAELMVGQNWQQWGMPYYAASVGSVNFTPYLRGIRRPQIAFRYFFTKELNAMVGITSATEWAGTGTIPYVRQYNDDYARSSWPGLQGEIAYWTDRCGRIGPHNLKFALGGFFGRESRTYADDDAWEDDTLNSWIAAFRYSLPIIPQKKEDKAMSLLLVGNFFYGQNTGGNNWLGTSSFTSQRSYLRTPDTAAAPTVFGLFAQGSFWITNNLSINGLYGYLKYNFSSWARNNGIPAAGQTEAEANDAARSKINMLQSYAVNLLWDTNQSVRLGVEWMRIFNSFNGYTTGGGVGTGNAARFGQLDQYRFAAWYFF